MAVIDSLDGITTSIIINGQRAHEYPSEGKPPDDSSVPMNICYVECKAGQTFAIEITVDSNRKLSKSTGLLFRVLVDGEYVNGKALHRPLTQQCIFNVTGPLDISFIPGRSVRRLLTFAPVSTGKCVHHGRVSIAFMADFSLPWSGGCALGAS